MQAIRIEQYGGLEVLRRVNIDIPSPGRGELLVRVACAGVNFMDIHTRQGKYRTSQTYPVRAPCTLGMEGAGEVVRTGLTNDSAPPTSCRKRPMPRKQGGKPHGEDDEYEIGGTEVDSPRMLGAPASRGMLGARK